MTARPDDEVFWEALQQATQEQQHQSVRLLCAGDEDQYARVLELLNTHHKMHSTDSNVSILNRSGDLFAAFSPRETLSEGDAVGPYRIIRLLGEGGMGLVYEAHQMEPVSQNVALKLLKPGMDSQRVLARFAFERQVLEQMDHPGITRVFDAGIQPNGRPYFAMELLENAVKITTYCDQQQLGIKDRLRLLIEVCQIVQHAHQRGVIHRDLKPSNVLICKTPDGSTPKVIDFGIAKAIEGDLRDDSNLTVLGERMGTPAYMSPEQARHSAVGIDVRTDVYSLGALLYELISGQVPREQPTLKDSGRFTDTHWDRPIVAPSVRVARSPESAKTSAAHRCSPAQLKSQLQGELDWITQSPVY